MTANSSEHPLFRSPSADGKTVMLSIADNGTWTIRRDGELIADGPGDQISIDAAVKKFRALVRPPGTEKTKIENGRKGEGARLL